MRSDSRKEIDRILATYRKDWPFFTSHLGKLTIGEVLLGVLFFAGLIFAGALGILD